MQDGEDSSFLNPADVLEHVKVQAGMRVADFGAGAGFFTRAAARLVAGGDGGQAGVVWAVDTNTDLLVRIKNLSLVEGLPNVEIVQGDIERPGGSNLPPGRFDLVIIANTLFASDEKLQVAQEAYRVLGPHGRAVVVDWKDSFGGLGPHPDHVLTTGAARDLFEKAGFAYIEDVPAGAYHWGFVVRKKNAPAA
ncbi:MAG: class I SAM-dependent methyltransferase [bacterium]